MNETKESIFYNSIKKCKYFIQKVDIYKWLILYKIGGLYLDMDISIHKTIHNKMLEIFNNNNLVLNYMQVWQYIPFKVVNNGIIWSKPNNIIILNFLNSISWDNQYFKNKDWEILDTTGPFQLTRWINNNKNRNDILILDHKYFEGRPLVYIKDQEGIYTTHLHHSAWMDKWLYIFIFFLKNLFFIIGLYIAYLIYKKILLKIK